MTSPLWLVAPLLIKLDSKGPVLYAATRIGRGGEPFKMYKFRTMVVDVAGPPVTAQDDPRITRVGRWLRMAKLDELPQLINVLRGDMSIVGPRPEVPEYVRQYTQEQRRILDFRPGITSPATVAHRGEATLLMGLGPGLEAHYLTTVLPAKLKIDIDYFERRTLRSDLGILLATARAVLSRP